jgi:hypothetical protein
MVKEFSDSWVSQWNNREIFRVISAELPGTLADLLRWDIGVDVRMVLNPNTLIKR